MDRSSVAANIESFLNLIWLPGEVRELRSPQYSKFQTASGFFDSPSAMAKAAAAWDGRANLYVTLNPVKDELLGVAFNHINEQARKTTSDADIISRKWLYLDIDPQRKSRTSSSEPEREAARGILEAVTAYLSSEGWPAPLTAMSGNGYYALYRIELGNGAEETALIRSVLEVLAGEFNSKTVHIDTLVYNAARIAGIIGTMKLKGDNTPERPHRRSEIVSRPESLDVVPAELLRGLAAKAPKTQPRETTGMPWRTASLRDALDQCGIEYRIQPPDAQGFTWYHVKTCPFHDDGRDFECGVGQKLPDGPFAGHCFHPEGSSKGWHEFKEALGLQMSRNDQDASPPRQREDILESCEPLRLTDTWNARRLAADHREDILWCETFKQWFTYDGTRYTRDLTRDVERRAERTVVSLYEYAGTRSNGDERRRLAEWAVGSESRHRMTNMIESAKRMVPVHPLEFDRDPLLFNVLNGTIDLHTQSLRQHGKEDRLSKRAEVVFDTTAGCPRWMEFLDRIFVGNQNIISFVQRLFGYGLTGLLTEHIIVILYGTGANGKSTLLGILRSLAGDYAIHCRPEVFTAKRNDSQGFELVALAGARVVTASETTAGRRLDESLVKEMTGGEPIRCAPKYGDFITFQPAFKPFLATNHKPEIRGVDEGIWRRVILLPFTVTIPEAERDRDLPAKLKDELSGILNWALLGTKDFLATGLRPPDEVRSATADYRTEQDVLANWIEDRCVLGADVYDWYSELYKDYVSWCEANQEEPVNKDRFSSSLDERGCPARRGTKGKRRRLGIARRSSGGDE